MSGGDVLPLKAQNRLKKAEKYLGYEQFAKGLKVANELLAEYPNASTLVSLKSRLLYGLKKPEDSIPLGELAVSLSPGILVNWERLGEQYTGQWEYAKALRCFTHIVSLAPTNTAHLRTYASLLLQARNYRKFCEVSTTLWTWQGKSREAWVHYCVSLCACGEFARAARAIETGISVHSSGMNRNQLGEMTTAMVWALLKAGDGTGADEALGRNSERICDLYRKMKYAVKAKVMIGDIKSALEACHALFAANPWNGKTLDVLLTLGKQQGLDPYAVVSELAGKHPCSDMLALRRMKMCPVSEFLEMLHTYVTDKVRKGVPSLGSFLKAFYGSQEKAAILDSFLRSVKTNLCESQSIDKGTEESALTRAWGFYLCSQHFLRLSDLESALECINSAIHLSPSIPDFHLLLGSILKRSSLLPAALQAREDARHLDLRDRYLNYQAAKYHLLCNDIESAHRVITPFSVSDEEPGLQFHENQEVKYEVRIAEARLRLGELQSAAEMFLDVEEHFRDMYTQTFKLIEDLELRCTVLWYLKMLRASEKLFANRIYLRAGKGFLRCVLQEHSDVKTESIEIFPLFLKRLMTWGKGDEELQRLLFNYCWREGKVFLCVKAIVAIRKLNAPLAERLKLQVSESSTRYIPQVLSLIFPNS